MSTPVTQAVPLVESGNATFGRQVTGELDATHGVVLYLESISVSFDGFKALNNLSLSIDVGELRCVIGPNGAGKTTMMDVITGKTRPDSGTAFFGQTIDLTRLSEAEIAHAGIGRKFQKPTIFENHTAFENLELAMKADKRVRRTLAAKLTGEERDRIAGTLELIRLDESAERMAGLLSHGQKQWLEIGMLLVQEPRLLLLDEPVAGMSDEETRAHRGAVPVSRGQPFAGGGRARHGLHREDRAQGDRASRGRGARRRADGAGAQRSAGDRGLPGTMTGQRSGVRGRRRGSGVDGRVSLSHGRSVR